MGGNLKLVLVTGFIFKFLRVLGGGVSVLGLSVTYLFLIASESVSAETAGECKRRVADFVKSDSWIVEKNGQFYIPTDALQRNPLFFRNMIVALYNNPQISAFFNGIPFLSKSIHYMKGAYELGPWISRLDSEGDYRFDSIVSALEEFGIAGQTGFDLDFSQLQKVGLKLGFAQTESAQASENKLKSQFINEFVRSIAETGRVIPLAAIAYRHTGSGGSFVIADSFFSADILSRMRHLLVEYLHVASVRPYEDYFKKIHPTYALKIDLKSDAGDGFDLVLIERRQDPSDTSRSIYEVSLPHGGPQIDGSLLIQGEPVEWFSSPSGLIGMISLARDNLPGALQVSIQTLGGRVSGSFKASLSTR